MMTGFEVKFGEEQCPMQLIQQLLNDGDWKFIWYHHFVENPVTETHVP